MTGLAFETRDAANGETLLFLHGLACAGESFAGAWRAPALAAYGLLVPDLVGHGASRPGPATLEDHVAALVALLAEVRPRRLHLVCHSMGGAVGLLLAREPSVAAVLASFVDVEGNLGPADCGLFSRRAAALTRDAFVARGFGQRVRLARRSDDAAVRLWGGWMERADAASVHASAESLVAWSDSGGLVDLLLSLPVPRVYVCGGEEPLPDSLVGVEDVPIKRFVGAGHFVMTDAPEAFYPWLAGWLP